MQSRFRHQSLQSQQKTAVEVARVVNSSGSRVVTIGVSCKTPDGALVWIGTPLGHARMEDQFAALGSATPLIQSKLRRFSPANPVRAEAAGL